MVTTRAPSFSLYYYITRRRFAIISQLIEGSTLTALAPRADFTQEAIDSASACAAARQVRAQYSVTASSKTRDGIFRHASGFQANTRLLYFDMYYTNFPHAQCRVIIMH